MMRVLEHVSQVENICDILCWCGVYIIHTKSGDRYVGYSENLKKRLCSHNNKDVKFIELYITDTVECARCLESDLILDLQPELNIRGKSFGMMTKTIQISDETHILIAKKWVELKEMGKNMTFAKVAGLAIQKGLVMI